MKVDQEQTTELHRRVGRLEGLVEGIQRRLDDVVAELRDLRGEMGELRREVRAIGLGLAALIGALGLWG